MGVRTVEPAMACSRTRTTSTGQNTHADKAPVTLPAASFCPSDDAAGAELLLPRLAIASRTVGYNPMRKPV